MKGADPDDQDIFGNTVLHMVVVTGQLVIYTVCMGLLSMKN
jgi:ankyrin repeat protein